ncbi:MAG TPA: hypothetical protein VFC09_04565 [Candidatus Dormibacteraeota bacterium]|nr:hypothetical protein [Candidatus Dormibacteraeota bacterium]
MAAVERAVEDHWDTVQFPEDLIARARARLLADIAKQREAAGSEIVGARRRVKELTDERRRLARGDVDGSIPGDLAREEHLRIEREREDAVKIMRTAEVVARHVERTLAKAWTARAVRAGLPARRAEYPAPD